jgi:hypothetical protein
MLVTNARRRNSNRSAERHRGHGDTEDTEGTEDTEDTKETKDTKAGCQAIHNGTRRRKWSYAIRMKCADARLAAAEWLIIVGHLDAVSAAADTGAANW